MTLLMIVVVEVGAGGVGGIGAGGLSDYTWDFGDEALGNLDDINKKAKEISDNIQKAVPWVLPLPQVFLS